MKPQTAFEIGWKVYREAGAVLGGRVPIADLNRAPEGEWLWRPDRLPDLGEYRADFELAARGALSQAGLPPRHAERLRRLFELHIVQDASFVFEDEVHAGAVLSEEDRWKQTVAGMGAVEGVVLQWLEELQALVGRQLLERKICPPSEYFKKRSAA